MRRIAVGGALLALAWSVVCVGTPAAVADSGPPYSDLRATSSLALCGKDGTQVTSGSTSDRPFVWRAISSSSAPPPYDEAGRTATLFAYQPRPQVDAAEWSGELLTASARYTDVSHPMAAATDLDEPLSDFLDAYPTKLDGFVQLRLYLGAPQEPAFTLKYAAANIQVSGGTWHLVGRPADVSCTSGTAVSLEAILPTPAPSVAARAKSAPTATASAQARPGQPVTTGPDGSATSRSARSSSVSSSSAGAAAGGAAAGDPAVGDVAAAGTGGAPDNGNASRVSVVVAALAVLAVGAVAWWRWPMRRRRGRADDRSAVE